jgi:asparagine synthase (glutamine-hydrolysing)
MCGIAGILQLTGPPPDPALIRRMTGAMLHRGPDDEGLFADGNLALGFRRLSIIDLASGHQPMTSDCGRYTVVFNGEIYNYRELRAVLEKDHGARFRTGSDTEVLLASYRAWGPPAVSRFNGMFAFALWDTEERVLFLARDRLGKKPLYWTEVPGGFAFASEVKALLQHPGVSAELERRLLPSFLAYRYVPGAETLFKDVHCLPPGHTVTISAHRGIATPERYWDYDFGPPHSVRPANEVRDRFYELLEDSVRLRLIADVPVGAFLSGGLDSSIIVALMSQIHPEPLKTFSIGFETGLDETVFARQVAERHGTDHHEVRVGSRDLIENIPRVLHSRETPITEASDIPIFLLSKLARTKVTVVLSGEGSDEILAGYPKYAFVRTLGPWLGALPRPALARLARALPFRLRRAQLALECLAEDDRFERHAGWFGAFPPRERAALLSPAMSGEDGIHAASREAIAGKTFPSAVEEMLYLDTRHWLPANLLLRGDRMTMAHSLELRCPFLDYRLVEFAAREVPTALKIRGLAGKWLLKVLAEPLLPREVIHRRKWGFKVPTSQWFRGPLLGVLKDVLLSKAARERGYFNEGRVRALIEDHAAGRTDQDKRLWILFTLELWHLMFVDRTLSPGDSLA